MQRIYLIASRVSGLYFSVCVWLQPLPSAVELGSQYLAVLKLERVWNKKKKIKISGCF
jgi:hypothetical protein